jgi:hypothetical protein
MEDSRAKEEPATEPDDEPFPANPPPSRLGRDASPYRVRSLLTSSQVHGNVVFSRQASSFAITAMMSSATC